MRVCALLHTPNTKAVGHTWTLLCMNNDKALNCTECITYIIAISIEVIGELLKYAYGGSGMVGLLEQLLGTRRLSLGNRGRSLLLFLLYW